MRGFTRTLSHLCRAIRSNTFTFSCPTGTPLRIITGADTPIQHHHGVCHYDGAHHTQHCCQEQFHWRWRHKWNLTAADTTTHRLHAHYRALPRFTTVYQEQLTASIDSLHKITFHGIHSTFLSALHRLRFVSSVCMYYCCHQVAMAWDTSQPKNCTSDSAGAMQTILQ
jgi:hypothetical protein